MKHYMPVRVFSGAGAVRDHAALFASFGARCALVTGRSAAEKCGALADVAAALTQYGVAWCRYSDIGPNPALTACAAAGRQAHEFGAAFVVGIGGGSALDAAKAAAVFAANPALDEEGFYQKRWENAPLPILLVGTTAGTGSEVTKVSVLTDSRGRKHSIHRNADEISRAFAIRGIRLLYAPLRKAAEGAELDAADRTALYDASLLGGLAICGTGTCFPHNVGYYLTENYGVPHGFASARFLPALLALAEEKTPACTERFFRELGLAREELLRLIGLCLPENEIAMTAEEIAAALPRWENNGSVRNTVCDVSTAEIGTILEQLFSNNGKET